jgi:hypothetical protein
VRIGDPTTVEDGSMTMELLDVYVGQGQMAVVEYTVLVTVRSLSANSTPAPKLPHPSPASMLLRDAYSEGVFGALELNQGMGCSNGRSRSPEDSRRGS